MLLGKRAAIHPSKYLNHKTWRMTPSFIRARQPYFWKNFATFFILAAIPTSAYFYTYKFLGKDDLADIEIPPISEEDLKKLKAEYEAEKKLEGK
ncbi:Coa3p ASCRUDRAFT_76351 [Ascoidea rubescens DSM 1968]|uniref:Cytochrome c oxidase assembly factor 3 n=1 Tax=Ascoidea rubescens DSM 1968 TaxID=1344418 RepID=A0A1D2VFQ9_9ASCO|nr:hypothetical protein ASCRUDRAFT_76351 [Ascoidea rubescens DSM 1968]ODV60353.1 hypothetical protein ASCRUDRAFT_76351 [Ascoidea rubescens DSM 1968]